VVHLPTTNTRIDFLGLDHIALNCSDMKRTVAFYNGLLGMPILHTLEYTAKDENGDEVPVGQHFFFGVGGENHNAHLAFFYWKNGYHPEAGNMSPAPRPAGVYPRATKPGVVMHINLRVAQERIPEYCKLLGDAGIEYRHTTRYGDPWREVTTHNGYTPPTEGCLMDSVYFDDPDGLHLEFNAWLPLWDSWRNDDEPWADPRTTR
jgi:catechol 2,3-dioxygenase-like lactoylglutathione lyase family enzyme